jgi:hypothetical protein
MNFRVMMVDGGPHWSLTVCEEHMAKFNDAGINYYVIENHGELAMTDDECEVMDF